MNSKKLLLLLIILFLFSPALAGRPDADWKTWFPQFGIGYMDPQGDAGTIADGGVTLTAGAVLWPQGSPVGYAFDLGFNDFDIKDAVADAAGASDGDGEIWSLTANVIWSPETSGPFGFDLSGGVGGYRIEARLTDPGLWLAPICDPWGWYCYPGVVPGDIVRESFDTSKLGYNVGAALTYEMSGGSVLYFKVEYHSIQTKNSTEYMPFTFGVRW